MSNRWPRPTPEARKAFYDLVRRTVDALFLGPADLVAPSELAELVPAPPCFTRHTLVCELTKEIRRRGGQGQPQAPNSPKLMSLRDHLKYAAMGGQGRVAHYRASVGDRSQPAAKPLKENALRPHLACTRSAGRAIN